MRTAEEIKKETLEAAKGDVQAAIAALEDGQYLTGAGYTDDDQEAIECAHDLLKSSLYKINFDGDGFGEYGVHDGFFNAVVRIDGIDYDFQCCTDEHDGINWNDCGYDDGLCGDANQRLADKIGWDEVLDVLKVAYKQWLKNN